jgi:hypothetical protein
MGKQVTLGGDGRFFMGEDKAISVEVVDRAGVPVDVAGWTTTLVITRTVTSAALLTASGEVSGTYSATRADNTQRITFVLTDDQTDDLTAGVYHYSVKRTGDDVDAVLLYGVCYVQQANQV